MKETQLKLLQAAAQQIADNGFEKTNVNHVAEAADLSIGTLYNYFPTKRNLMHAIIDHISQLHVTFIIDKVMETTEPSQRMEAFFKSGFAFIESNLTQAKAFLTP